MAVNHSETDAVERCSENCEPTRAGPSVHYRTQSRGQAGTRIFLQLFPTAGAAQPRHEGGGYEVELHVFDHAGTVASRSQG